MTAVIQVVGYKNTGKTTLVEKLVRALTEAGYQVGTVKRDAHQFDVDHEGTDTWRHRQAGARMTAITSADRTAIMEEKHTPLDELLQRMGGMDIVIVEGFKQERYPKIVLVRSEEDLGLVSQLAEVKAIVSWLLPEPEERNIPVLGINDTEAIVRWLRDWLSAHK